MFTVQETAARREAEQLRVSQSRSTETVNKLQPGHGSQTASRVTIQVNRDGRSNCIQLGSRPSPNKPCLPRRWQKQQSDEKKISIQRMPQGAVRDLILLTMWVLSPIIVVVIFILCIDCSGWAFCAMECCPQISPSVYIIYDWTTSVYSYFHDNNISKCYLPQPAKHYIQYSLLACHRIMILASLPASCFWSQFWGLKSPAFSDLESFCYYEQVVAIVGDHPYCELFVGMSNVPSRYHAQGITEMGAGHRHRQLCRP